MDPLSSILVVDDDHDIRQTLAEMLCDGRRQVATARDGFEALEKLDCLERPCIVLLDLMMPRMNGLDFLEHLSRQESRDQVSVIVMSAHDGLRREAQRHATVRAALMKPFDFEGLVALVGEGHTGTARSGEGSAESPRDGAAW
jgi:CheY-like chemotaxis protein